MKKKITLISHKELKAELMKDPKFVEEYNKLETEFQIARQMIDLRAKYKLTQQELAQKSGSAQAVISRLERGNTNTSIALLQRIVRAVDAKFIITIQ